MGVVQDRSSFYSGKAFAYCTFITELTSFSREIDTDLSAIESVVYGIKWGHSVTGNHPLVKSSLEGPTRKLARPVRRKEPLSVDIQCKPLPIIMFRVSLLPPFVFVYFASWFLWVFWHRRDQQFFPSTSLCL